MAVLQVGLVLALAIAALGCASTRTADPTPMRRATPGAPSEAPRASVSQGTGALAGSVTAADPTGDLLNQDDQPAAGHGNVDVVGLDATAEGDDFTFTIRLAAAPPASVSTIDGEYNLTFVVDVDGDSFGDYWISLENRESGAWSPVLYDVRESSNYYDDRFPGGLTLVGELLLGRVSRTALGTPNAASVCAVTQFVDHVTGDVVAEDNAPDGTCLGAGPFLSLE